MSAGYVYILINSSMPGLLKIGRTFRDSKSRARELHTTGVPTPFEVAFELFAEDHETVEKKLHEYMADFRVANNREFFRYPLLQAIKHLLDLSSPSQELSSSFCAQSIFAELSARYKNWIKPSVVDVRIIQTQERVWLEITEEEEISGYLVDQTIKRSDLAFCVGDDDSKFFSPADSVMTNSAKFIEEWDPYSIIMTTDLFHLTACQQIDNDPDLNPHKRIY
ncbi:GIY-YIG nuclease family protein [Chromobacterium subtsugae]|uniref:GIY-YIG nuclease family protein n=1 Tax=Chromobacterium subtsugae TaxID=251747 RepID=UPI000640FC9A|nr:GIY-YIG nuclease family protein [Chromobacterium subtsugae]